MKTNTMSLIQKKASNFVTCHQAYQKLCKVPEMDNVPQWGKMLKEMKKLSQEQMLESLPESAEDLHNSLDTYSQGDFLFYETTYSDFWRKLDSSIVSFKGFEQKALKLIASFLPKDRWSAKPCIPLLYRKEMLLFYHKRKPQLLSDIIGSIMDFKPSDLQNACLPHFFVAIAPILKEDYPLTFALLQDKIASFVDVWDKKAAKYAISPGWSQLIEGHWSYFDEGFKENLLFLYK